MRKEINIEDWHRKKAYNIFSTFDDPYTGVVTNLNITNLVLLCKNKGYSFYGTMLYFVLDSMNEIDEFKYGYSKKGDKEIVYKYDEIAATLTTLKDNKELTFTRYIKFEKDYLKFIENFNTAKKDAELGLEYYKIPNLDNMNKIQVTCLPWIRFTNFKDAINHSEKSSKPKICWGKYYLMDNEYYIDFSILVNHAFQDGLHMSLFLNNLQDNISNINIELKEKEYAKTKKKN